MLFVCLIGLITSVIVSACKSFFFLAHRVVPYSLSENFLYFLTRETAIPAFALIILYFLLSRDSFEFKFNSVFYLEAGFYAVYCPYCVMNSDMMNYSIFPGFIKPVVFGAMCVILGKCANFVYSKSILIKIAAVLCSFISVIIPALLDAFYCTSNNTVLLVLFSFLFCAAGFLLPAIKLIKKIVMKKE